MLRRLLNLIRPSRLHSDIQEELAFHRSQTKGSFGNFTSILERTREAGTIVWLETLLQDLRIAVRLLRRTPTLTTVALLSIALSVGATAVVFTAIQSVLLKPLPYAYPSRLVQLRSDDNLAGAAHTDWLFWNDAQEIARRTRTLQSVGIYRNAVFDLGGGSSAPPEALYGLLITANLFPTLGVSPMIGRNISSAEDQPGRANEIILSYGLWTRRFHSDRRLIGLSIRIDASNCLVIGVMPPDFNFPLRRAANHTPAPYVEFWAPLRIHPKATQSALGAVARLRPGSSFAEAAQDVSAISAALSHEFPTSNRDRTLRAAPLWDRTVGSARPALWLLFAASLLFLLIGCANVANLLLARGFARRREMSMRMAIGAARGRIIRQLLTESCLLALLGGLAGYLLTVAAWQIVPSIAPVSIPRLSAAHPGWRILLFSVALALLNGILFGLAPALRSAGSPASGVLPDLGARGAAAGRHDQLRTSLVMAEIAITVTLVLLGSQLLGSFLRLIGTDPGFQASRVLASVVLPDFGRYPTQPQRATVYRRFLDAVRRIPGVDLAGTVDALPFSGENNGGFISTSAATDPRDRLVAEIDTVGGDYLPALGVRLQAGRWFRAADSNASSDTAIISNTLARRLWPHADPLEKRICVNCSPQNPPNWKRVVGVVSGIRHADLDAKSNFSVYLSAGAFEEAAFLVVRTARPSESLEHSVRAAIAAVDPDQPVLLSVSMQSLIADTVADRRFIISLLTVMGCLALLMCLAGIYGVAAYTASRRTQEIGIRMALGATATDVHALLLRQGLVSVVAGLALGLALSVVLLQALQGVLAGLQIGNPAIFWLSAGAVLLAALLASLIPAHRAARLDPMHALRQE